MSEALPARANLDYLKKVCKERVRTLRAAGKPAKLASVQRDIARQYGFKSWTKLRAHVQAKTAAPADRLADAITLAPTGDTAGLTALLKENPAALTEMKGGVTVGIRALHAAVEHNQVDVIRWLLAEGVPVNGTTE